VLWELSLNETPIDAAFAARLHAIGHEEYPGDQMFTCGWVDHFDVFSHARQHGQIHTWQNGDKALVIAEYGDWEYYAKNAGFDQVTGAGVFDTRSNSRQLRADGERGLRRQACNHVMALNDVLSSPAVLDGQWAVFDYARGYDAKRAAVGVMDIFRLPKFSYYFFRSQRSADEIVIGREAGYNIFIASLWTAASDLRVVVFSNCDEVELQLNGRMVARQPRSETSLTQHLPHPPFFFDLPRFVPGTLEAIGYVASKARATTRVITPESVTLIDLTIDDLGVRSESGEADVLIAHAKLIDRQGTLCVDESAHVTFSATGAQLMGTSDVAAEAGIASVVLRVPPGSAKMALIAALANQPGIRATSVEWSRGHARNPAVANVIEVGRDL
jgi:beta-galactosidase